MQKITYLMQFSAILLMSCIHNSFAAPEDPWYDHSIKVYMGAVNNAATIAGRDSYKPLEMGSDAEMGVGFTLVVDPDYDAELSVSQLTSAGTQRNAAGSGNENNFLSVSIDIKKLSLTGKRIWGRNDRPFVSWLGLGIDAGMVETVDTEGTSLSYGSYSKATRTHISTGLGAHASGGFDIYPIRTSALALSVEARYGALITEGPFRGDLNSFALLFGIRWDFWPSTF